MYKHAIFFCTVIMCFGALNQALAQESETNVFCSTASGKITNNAQEDGSTLGVVALKLDEQKLKCGIIGQPQYFGPYNFRHTIVCDDKASTDSAQAQITFNTKFSSDPTFIKFCPDGSYSFSFEEEATPDPSTGRGAFKDVTDGASIYITGSFNCDGGIIMKFDGNICYSE